MMTVSDTSPVHYLVLIGQAELLPKLFGDILIPGPVAVEMRHPRAPGAVREWIACPPDWISIRETGYEYVPKASGLGRGEIAAIALAIEVNADAVLMDDRAAIREGRNSDLTVLTTFSVLELAAIRNLIDFEEVLAALAQTTFRMPPDDVVNEYLRRNTERKLA
ncbi:MAG: DUF3368 domain-containing protein [Pyrinomonadaceae bacterium]